MNTLLFFITLGTLAVVYAIIGFLASKRVSTTSDYFLADRNLGMIGVTFTLIATQLGGGMLLGTSQRAYEIGWFGIFYTLGIVAGFLLLGSGIAARLQSLNVATTAELFQTRYNSAALKKFASLLSIITLCGLLIGQIVASKSILSSLAVYNEWFFILFWLLIIAFTMVGGLKAVVATDTAQVLFILIIFSGIFVYALLHEQSLASALASIFKPPRGTFDKASLSGSALTATIIMPALFALIEQDLAQRFFAARSRTVATMSAFCASFVIIAFACIPIYLGMQAKLQGLAVPAGIAPLIPVVSALTNDFVLVLAICGVLAAITSTADSLLCAISSNFALDFDTSWIGIANKLRRSQFITLIIGLVAVALSYLMPRDIISILITSYELPVSCLFVPLVVCYFKKRVSKQAAIASIVTGLVLFLALPFWHTTLPKEIIPLICSGLAYLIADKLFVS